MLQLMIQTINVSHCNDGNHNQDQPENPNPSHRSNREYSQAIRIPMTPAERSHSKMPRVFRFQTSRNARPKLTTIAALTAAAFMRK